MVSHLGEAVEIANRALRSGNNNDHVEVYSQTMHPTLYAVVFRGRFEQGPLARYFQTSEKAWQNIEVIAENCSREGALATGRKEAEKRNVVLYLGDRDASPTVHWHPQGWTPVRE